MYIYIYIYTVATIYTYIIYNMIYIHITLRGPWTDYNESPWGDVYMQRGLAMNGWLLFVVVCCCRRRRGPKINQTWIQRAHCMSQKYVLNSFIMCFMFNRVVVCWRVGLLFVCMVCISGWLYLNVGADDRRSCHGNALCFQSVQRDGRNEFTICVIKSNWLDDDRNIVDDLIIGMWLEL